MSVETWGMLEKAQDDPQKIDEAVATAIAEHNADEESHLAEGQALQSHKMSEIIDHRAKSIVEDKFDDGAVSSRAITADQIVGKDFRTATDVGSTVSGVKFNSSGIEMWQNGERKVNIPVSGNPEFKGVVRASRFETTGFFLFSQFESIDGWNQYKVGANSQIVSSLCHLNLISGDNSGEYASIYSEFGGATINWSSDNPVFEVVCRDFAAGYSDKFLLCGSNTISNVKRYIGFFMDASPLKLYAVWGNGTASQSAEITGIDTELWHKYRVEKIGSAIYYYIDGVLKYTATSNLPSGEDDYSVLIKIKNETSAAGELTCRSVLASTETYL